MSITINTQADKMKKRASIRDVARVAGVSAVTVSAALNGGKNVSEKRRGEIQALARKMGYQPNTAARLLKSKRIMDIGLLIFEREALIRENAATMDITVQFMKECLRNRIQFQMEWFDCYRNKEEVPRILTGGLVGGLLVYGQPANAAKRFMDEELRFPHVTLNEPGRYRVYFQDADLFRQAFYYLVSLGHRRVGLINGPPEITVFQEYRSVFEEAAAELSLTGDAAFIREDRLDESFAESLARHTEAFLGAPERPTALFVHSGLFCKAFIAAIRREGVRVPEDLSVICYETLDWEAEKFSPPITAIDRHYRDFVVAAVSMVRDLMDGKSVAQSQYPVSSVFTKRATVAEPRRD